ncbi:MAG: hypothetical protein WAT92_00350 [Saprospiraceae bacterium]
MTTSNFTNEITQIALFAKRINFNVESGCMLELTRLWLADNQKLYNAIEDNKNEAKRIIKTYL